MPFTPKSINNFVVILNALVLIGLGNLGWLVSATAWAQPATLKVTQPPESFFEIVSPRHRAAAREFYRKYLDVGGLPVVAAGEVVDEALVRTHTIVTHLLAGRPDVLKSMAESGMYLIIIGRDQVYTDMPEYRNAPDPDFMNERVRGTGGKPTSFGEENLLGLALDRYDDESIGVHEFCHTIDGTLRRMEPEWGKRLQDTYQATQKRQLYQGAYAGTNPGEYWAEICQAYFDCNRVNNYNHGPVGTREQLKSYDPLGYELVRTTFRLSPEQDWRYQFPRAMPQVETPPAKLQIDPYYTKFCWARELSVLGKGASDQALLRANDIVRKMFAYRQDILKAFIAAKLRLVVLAPDESLSDLPELQSESARAKVDLLARYLCYTPDQPLLVVDQQQLLSNPHAPGVGSNQLVRVLASAIHELTGKRAIDPEWDNRPRQVWQQYELRLERLDERFDQKVRELHQAALSAGKWQGTAAANSAEEYWIAGVLAYFDAAGQEATPTDNPRAIQTREQLAEYDPGLNALVTKTMAYNHRVDWRLSNPSRP